MKCQNCGAALTQGQAFCTQCGAAVSISSQPKIHPPHFSVPEGFVRDPESGLYYTSQTLYNRETGKTIQRVTYFNIETGVIQPIDYPLDNAIQISPQTKEGKPRKSRLKNLIIVSFGVVILTAFMMLGVYSLISFIKPVEDAPAAITPGESWEEYQQRREKEKENPETKEDNKKGGVKDSEKSEEEEQIKLVPYSTDSGSYINKDLSDSTYTASTYEDEEYSYFLSPERKEIEIEIERENPESFNPETTPPPNQDDWGSGGQIEFLAEEETSYLEGNTEESLDPTLPSEFFQEEEQTKTVMIRDTQGNAIYRMTKATGEVEALVTAKKGTILHDFVIIGDQLFYQLSSVSESGEPDFTYYEVWGIDMVTGESRFITHSKDSPLGSYEGYLYMMNHTGGFIKKYGVGKDSGVKDISNNLKYNFDLDTTLHMSNFSIYNDKSVVPIYNYEENRQFTYLYNIKSGETEILFKGKEDHLYRNTYVTPTSIFSVEFNGRLDELQIVTFGVTYRGMENASEDYHPLSVKEGVQWYDKGIFFHVIDDTIYYEKGTTIVSAPLNDPGNAKVVVDIHEEISSVIGSMVIFEDNVTYDLLASNFSDFEPMNVDSPLLEKNVTFGRNPEKREQGKFPSEDVDYYSYDGEIQFPRENDELIRLIANGIPYLNMETKDQLDTRWNSLPLLYGMLRSGNLMGGINPDGSLNLEAIGRFCFDVFQGELSPEDLKKKMKDSRYFLQAESGEMVLSMDVVPEKRITGIEVEYMEESEDGFLLAQIGIYYAEHPVEVYIILGERNIDPIISQYNITSISYKGTIEP